MRILALVGSMRKEQHTEHLVRRLLSDIREAADSEVETAVLFLSDCNIGPCRVTCSRFCTAQPHRCCIPDDLPQVLARMTEADALVIGTPLYFRAPPARFQAFAERLVSMAFFPESRGMAAISPLQGIPCALIGMAEYSNPVQMLEYLRDFCHVVRLHPLTIEHFPYLGVAGQGELPRDSVFCPEERSRDLARVLIEAVHRRNGASPARRRTGEIADGGV